MSPEAPEEKGKRRSMLGVAAYLMVPGERRIRAAGHFGRAAMEAAKGVRALSVPLRLQKGDTDDPDSEAGSQDKGRQRIDIE